MRYFLVKHPDWSSSRKIEVGPNTNASDPRLRKVEQLDIETIGSSPQCRLVLPDKSLPDIFAIVGHARNQRGYVVKLPTEFHEQQAELEWSAIKYGWRSRIFEWEIDVGGYTILGMYSDEEGQAEGTRLYYPKTDIWAFKYHTYEERMDRDRRYNGDMPLGGADIDEAK